MDGVSKPYDYKAIFRMSLFRQIPSKLGNAVVFLGFSFVKACLKYWIFHISNT